MITVPRQLLSVVLSAVLIVPAHSHAKTIASDPNNVNGAASYVYDAVGNRTQKTSTIPGYPGGLTNYNANDQLSVDTYDNDAFGNLIHSSTTLSSATPNLRGHPKPAIEGHLKTGQR